MKPVQVVLFVSAIATAAQAQTAPPPSDTPPGTQPEGVGTARVRDGFYVRVNSNTSYMRIAGAGPRGHASVEGLGTGVLIAMGGTLARGLVLAGTLQATNTTAKFDGGPFEGATLAIGDRTIRASTKVDATVFQLGGLVDFYPRASLG